MLCWQGLSSHPRNTPGTVQAEPADSIRSIGATVDTGDPYCAKWSGDNFCLVTSSYDDAHPYCACTFVHIRSPMHIHNSRSEVWLWRIERFTILHTVKASVLQLYCMFLEWDSSFPSDSHSRQYIQHWPYSHFIYFHTLYKENKTSVPVIITAPFHDFVFL